LVMSKKTLAQATESAKRDEYELVGKFPANALIRLED